MKKMPALLSIILATAMPLAGAQDVVPVAAPLAIATPDSAAMAAANEMLILMQYRSTLKAMLVQMRQYMPTQVKQAVISTIYGSPKLNAGQQKDAVEKFYKELPQTGALIDGILNDPALLDSMVQEMAKMYAGQFTVDEMHQLSMFYRTPVGAKMLASASQMGAVMVQIQERLVTSRINAIIQDMLPK